MTEPLRRRTGGQILIDQLKIHGVDMAFGVPGESYLAALDALFEARNQIRFIICRQEGGACNMAEAYGKLTGRPGICFVTRGPGATNASIGLHTAFQDSTPMILLIGQVARDQTEREAFQEIDFRRMFGPVTKWVAEIDDARRIPELVSQAFHRATSGRPGPVVLALPEDMLTDVVEVRRCRALSRRSRPSPALQNMARLRELLAGAKRPLVILGGGGWSAKAVRGHRRLRRGQRPARRQFLPLPGSARQSASELCRRCRHRHQSEAGRARAARPMSCWSSARGWAR